MREAWQTSQSWNDLCRTPGLACEDTGNWHNDPVATRERLVPLLAQLEPGAWTTLDALLAAVKTTAPDFQRPDGDYDTWYISARQPNLSTGLRLLGRVEGALLRFLITGPLYWLGAVILGLAAQHSFSLSPSGYGWLTTQPSPTEFDLRAPYRSRRLHHPRSGRCAVARPLPRSRFTTWEPPTRSQPEAEPTFCYRITQSGLRRATEQGIDALRVLAFLQEHCTEPLPAPVVSGLQRWQNQSTPAAT